MLMSLSPPSRCLFLFSVSLYIFIFFSVGRSVEHLLLSLWLLFQCELLPTNDPFTNTLFPHLSSFPAASAAPHYSASPPSPPRPTHPAPLPLSLATSTSLPPGLPLPVSVLSALQELKEFSWDQVRSTSELACLFLNIIISSETEPR